MERKVNFSNSAGELLAGVLASSQNEGGQPIVVLTHGFGSGKDNRTNSKLTELLGASGIATFRFDFSGHGESSGSIEDLTLSKGVDELAMAVRAAEELTGVETKEMAFFGGSYGGNVTILFAARTGAGRAIALKSPISNYAAVRERQLGLEGVVKWREDGIASVSGGIKSRYSFFEDASMIDTYTEASRIKCPVLIVQGDADEDIPLQHSERLARSIGPHATIRVLRHVDHGYSSARDFDEMCRISVEFLTQQLMDRPPERLSI